MDTSKSALKHSYWLMKSEPNDYSILDLKRDRVAAWTGIRNYQVRNMLRDQVKKGDRVLFYHSSAKEIGVVGEMEVIKEAYPDPTQFDPKDSHYDKGARLESPRWFAVDVQFRSIFPSIITLKQLRAQPDLSDLRLLQKGNRLSILPVSAEHYQKIRVLAHSE